MPEHPTIQLIRNKALQRHGKNGIRSIGLVMRSLDRNGDHLLDPEELRAGLRSWGIALSDEDFAEVVRQFDRNGDGCIDATEFAQALRGPLSSRRKTVIEVAFRRIDKDNVGYLDVRDLAECYDVSRHPDVLHHHCPAAEAISKFLSHFDEETNPEGKVSFDEFLDYYSGVSHTIDDDKQFEMLLMRSWALDRPRNAPRPGLSLEATGSSCGSASRLGRTHPLYQTTSCSFGKQCDQVTVDKSHNRRGAFTNKQPPPQPYSGLNTFGQHTRV